MVSPSGRHVVTYNGEIYGYRELRRRLEGLGTAFRGSSDTEVLLAAVDRWGLEAALEHVDGMFAFALWDRRERQLHLVRDRLGEKPLFHRQVDGTFLFASELQALHLPAGLRATVDRDALAAYMRLGFVPAPRTILQDVRSLEPGCGLTVSSDGSVRDWRYWSCADVARRSAADPFEGSATAATDELDGLLRDAVRRRLVADVPLGAFLSGGLDSSLVVAAMQAESSAPVRTFTVAFDAASHDEAAEAAMVARHLGTDHTELRLSSDSALEMVPRIAQVYDQPLADPSQLPTMLMTAEARRHVTVCLSGDGGDEVFGGYNRYVHGPSLWRKLSVIPKPARTALSRSLLAPSHSAWRSAARVLAPLLPAAASARNPADKIQKVARVLTADDAQDLQRTLLSHWERPEQLVRGGHEPASGNDGFTPDATAEWLMLSDTASELPDNMLVKVDRASMAVGLEVRVPLLDPQLFAFAWRLPLDLRIRDGQGKWILRRLLSRYVPREIFERPKMGFDPPIGDWLRGPLRSWAQALLDPERLSTEGYLEPEPVQTRWRQHLSGERNWEYPLWAVLVFQSWLEHHRDELG